MTIIDDHTGLGAEPEYSSLTTAAARNLATTTKTVPQMQEITSRWLLRVLPWVQVTGGAYRVNRRLSYAVGDGLLTFTNVGSTIRVVPPELGELPQLRGFTDMVALEALADRFTQSEVAPGEFIVEAGQPVDTLHLLAHGKADKIGAGRYGNMAILGVLADGSFFGDQMLVADDLTWEFGVKAATRCLLLTLPRAALAAVTAASESLTAQLSRGRGHHVPRQNRHGEAEIDLSAGHTGEPQLPATFVDYELSPREYELSVAQAVLRVHTRVADLYNHPMNQVEQQLRLTVEALKERQEHEMVNNAEFGMLHNCDLKRGHQVPSWRGVPLFPCSKIPVADTHTTSIIAMRMGEAEQGVVGLHQTGIPDEYQPSLSVRFMGINDQAIMSYLVSAYYSVAVLVPDALGVLENVELGHYHG